MKKIDLAGSVGRQMYVPAKVKVIEFTSQRVLCGSGDKSGGIDDMYNDTHDWGPSFGK